MGDDGRCGKFGFEVAIAWPVLSPPGGGVHHVLWQRSDGGFLSRTALAAFENQHAGEQSVGEHAFRERGVVVGRDRCAEHGEARLDDGAGVRIIGF
ncbi:MAG: hypothetical protein ACKPJD_13775, partial [Planctomycetaceae bacterium]